MWSFNILNGPQCAHITKKKKGKARHFQPRSHTPVIFTGARRECELGELPFFLVFELTGFEAERNGLSLLPSSSSFLGCWPSSSFPLLFLPAAKPSGPRAV